MKKKTRELSEQDYLQSLQAIRKYYDSIKEQIVAAGLADDINNVIVRFGAELEFTKVAGKESFVSRMEHVLGKVKAEEDLDLEDKSESHMPENSWTKNMDKKFQVNHSKMQKIISPMRTGVDAEPLSTLGAGYYTTARENPDTKRLQRIQPSFHGYSQSEIVSYPMSPLAVTRWLIAVPNMLVDRANELGLDRITFKSKSNIATVCNSIHLNITVGVKNPNGTVTNLFQKNNFPSEFSGKKPEDKELSQLAIAIGLRRNKVAKSLFYLLAPLKNCYARFADNESSGLSHMGFFHRREIGRNGGAAFRGEKIEFSRIEAPKKDGGPLRIEDRTPCPEAIGHPNKKFYPEQKCSTAELIEMYMHILDSGIKKWAAAKSEEKTFKQSDLYKEIKIPNRVGKALDRFKDSKIAKAIFGNRMSRMVDRREAQAVIMNRDFSAKEPRGHDILRG